jgi:hypothetical protein
MTHNRNTTVLKIYPDEQYAVARICKHMGIRHRCYPVVNSDVVVAEILTNDSGSSDMFYRLIETEMENIKSSMPKLDF